MRARLNALFKGRALKNRIKLTIIIKSGKIKNTPCNVEDA